ncbi:hypothetical protein pb186bvf_013330 [Paramecium bursaria]
MEEIPLDILLAKLNGPILERPEHIAQLASTKDKNPALINNNFQLMSDKFKLLCGALPGCSPELIVEEFSKILMIIEHSVNLYLEKLKGIAKELRQFADYDAQKVKELLTEANQLIQQSLNKSEQDVLDEQFFLENFQNPETILQQQLLSLIFQRNQNLQNVMNKVGQEQIEYTVNFKNSLENIAQVNHFEPLNKLLNSQKNYWQSREQKAKERYQALKDDDHPIQQSQINIPNNHETQLIESLIKLRTHTHDLMAQHVQEQKKNKNKHSKIDGGGTFGFCWTGGYGWRGQIFENLDINQQCSMCKSLNNDMHSTAKQLFQLEYRDKGTWWVQAWFLYNN